MDQKVYFRTVGLSTVGLAFTLPIRLPYLLHTRNVLMVILGEP